MAAHPDADNGEPLLVWVAPGQDTRIGMFAMVAPTETGKMSPSVREEFLRRLPHSGCDAHLMITCLPESADLTALANRIRDGLGQPVAIEVWEPGGGMPPLRPAIDRLRADVTDSAEPSRTPRRTGRTR